MNTDNNAELLAWLTAFAEESGATVLHEAGWVRIRIPCSTCEARRCWCACHMHSAVPCDHCTDPHSGLCAGNPDHPCPTCRGAKKVDWRPATR